ncbi:MAG: hypothetical protein Q7S92_00690 [Candidatus Diapherotrites archaeon]|nr:hypothetical protein [Candidatus Diapherotrites archaeon]
MQRARFNPRKHKPVRTQHPVLGELELDKRLAQQKGVRYKSWAKVAKGWYGNTGISRPHIEFVRKPRETYLLLKKLAEHPTPENIRKINRIYQDRIQSCTQTLSRVFGIRNPQVVFESNGTMALAFLRGLTGAEGKTVLHTTDMGRIVERALQGEDTSRTKEDFKQPIGLFSHAGALKEEKISTVHTMDLYTKKDTPKTDTEICRELFSEIQRQRPALVIVPQISRSGRRLPVKRIGKFVKEFNQKTGSKIIFVVDGAQTIGRVSAEEMQNPLEYCDAYMLVGQKALGAMISAAVVLKPGLVEANANNLLQSSIAARLSRYQFAQPVPKLEAFLKKESNHYAVSLPEIESLDLALQALETRGRGTTFSQRRLHQVKRMQALQKTLVSKLNQVRGIKVLQAEPQTPRTHSIVTFTLTKSAGMTAEEFRNRLQELDSPITLAPLYQRPVLRIGLSELREQNLDYLVQSIKKILTKGKHA